MNVVYCTTCKGRMQHIARTLPQNLADNPHSKFVLLDYNDPGELAHYIQVNHAADLASGRLVYYKYREPVPFRMAHAKNMAHRLGMLEGGDILVNLDADNFAGECFTSYAISAYEARDKEDIFLWSRMVKGDFTRGISGRIVVTKNAFLLAGGYDEKYTTHSPDDKDFNARLRRLGFTGVEINPDFLCAIPHNDKMRYREYPEAAGSDEDSYIKHDHTVVNSGIIGCGMVFKNFSTQPTCLNPLPTRIFGIGMHKTATTSLHHALDTLGYHAAHWPSAHWAKAIWREMNAFGKSLTLEKHYAITDLPMPLLFRQLDKAYPGSKFILTLRDEDKWIESMRKHWDPKINPYRAQWDNDPFSHRVHQLLYKRTDFHPEVMLDKYRRHNAEVLEHFKGRSDLLVLHVDNGHGWRELCGFLGAPVPEQAYPVKNGRA